MTLVFVSIPRDRRRGFTLVEVLITMSIAVMAGTIFVGFAQHSGKSLINITNQASLNSAAGNASVLMVRRIRSSRLAEVTDSGNTLTLTFDDDGTADSDGDGDPLNDSDHAEIFRFYNTDGNLATPEDNGITYQIAAGVNPRKLISGVTRLGTADFFHQNITNSRRVEINFKAGLSSGFGLSQRIEIVTSGYRLNGSD